MATTYDDVLESFHSLFSSKETFDEGLEYKWFQNSLAWLELRTSRSYCYDDSTRKFADDLPSEIPYTLSLRMFAEYMRRDLTRQLRQSEFETRELKLKGATSRIQAMRSAVTEAEDRSEQFASNLMTQCYG